MSEKLTAGQVYKGLLAEIVFAVFDPRGYIKIKQDIKELEKQLDESTTRANEVLEKSRQDCANRMLDVSGPN